MPSSKKIEKFPIKGLYGRCLSVCSMYPPSPRGELNQREGIREATDPKSEFKIPT
jgi:hypothetical protein